MAAKAQHYLPQEYLRAFSHNHEGKKSEFLWTYDKHNMSTREVTVHDACHESYFYDPIGTDGVRIPFDSQLEKIERELLPVLKAIRNAPSPYTLERHKKYIAHLVTFFWNRSVVFRQEYTEMLEVVKADNPEVKLNVPKGDALKFEHVQYIVDHTPQDAAVLLDMQWVLVYNNTSRTFYTSDFPFILNRPETIRTVTVYEDNSVGLATFAADLQVPGIEVSFPLTPTLGLLFADSKLPRMPPVIDARDDYVRFVNRAHAVRANRYIFSSDNWFDFVASVVSERPDLFGPERQRVRRIVGDK